VREKREKRRKNGWKFPVQKKYKGKKERDREREKGEKGREEIGGEEKERKREGGRDRQGERSGKGEVRQAAVSTGTMRGEA